MLKGDLTTTPLAPLLIQLADEDATGCLHISDAEGDEALVYVKGGQVYAITVPGRRPQLGAKLVSSGALAPEALADAMEAQRTELQGWRLGELLVHLGYVDQPVVEDFVKEQVHDSLWDLMRWEEGRWKFRKNEKTREDVAPPVPVPELLAMLRERGYEWETISTVVHGPTAVPVLSTGGGGAPETTLDPDAWSMLCKIDGERSVAELARDCGYTLFEAGQILVTLVSAGLVDIEEDVEVTAVPAPVEEPDERYGASSVASALTAAEDAAAAERDDEPGEDDGLAALARVVSEVAASVLEPEDRVAERVPDLPSPVPLHPGNDQSFASSLARVSEALSAVLGEALPADDPFVVPDELRGRRPKTSQPAPDVSPEAERRRRTREAAAAELAAAHALAEALRAAQREEPVGESQHGGAEVVDLAAVRREAEEEAARVAAEEEAARVAAEQEAARVAAEQEAARLEAERLAAEEAARVAAEEEAARVAAEEAARVAAEEAARVAAEEEAARVAAEEAEKERLAAEEAARVAAEQEAARLEAERLAAEEATRVAAEEEAARVAAEEAARVAAEEEAARVAAEEAEQERLAADEATRVAAEQEAARLEAERIAAEEAERMAAEEAAARVEAERLATEAAEAEHEAWSEYWQREADALQAATVREAEATALLAELASTGFGEIIQPEPARDAEPEPAIAEVLTEPVYQQPTYVEPAYQEAESEDDAELLEPAAVAVGAPSAMSEITDTAALLRELSSLGVEDDHGSGPSAPVAPRPRPVPAQSDKKKKRGLFGR